MGSSDDTSHLTVIDGRNLFLFEKRHKLILLLAWVGARRAGADECSGQQHQDADGGSGDLRPGVWSWLGAVNGAVLHGDRP